MRELTYPTTPLRPPHVARLEPEVFSIEPTTVWSFPKRGDWATHDASYRGNWAPQVPRNLILRYTKPGEVVVDPMVGSGTTLIECKLLGRSGIGVDINERAAAAACERLNFTAAGSDQAPQRVFVGDARNLDALSDGSADLIAIHPPYANIIRYSDPPLAHDLSHIANLDAFTHAMEDVAAEALRVVRPGKRVAILIGDTRRRGAYVPLAFRTMSAFLEAGFELREDIVKVQWNCRDTHAWAERARAYNFHLIAHEHLFIFQG